MTSYISPSQSIHTLMHLSGHKDRLVREETGINIKEGKNRFGVKDLWRFNKTEQYVKKILSNAQEVTPAERQEAAKCLATYRKEVMLNRSGIAYLLTFPITVLTKLSRPASKTEGASWKAARKAHKAYEKEFKLLVKEESKKPIWPYEVSKNELFLKENEKVLSAAYEKSCDRVLEQVDVLIELEDKRHLLDEKYKAEEDLGIQLNKHIRHAEKDRLAFQKKSKKTIEHKLKIEKETIKVNADLDKAALKLDELLLESGATFDDLNTRWLSNRTKEILEDSFKSIVDKYPESTAKRKWEHAQYTARTYYTHKVVPLQMDIIVKSRTEHVDVAALLEIFENKKKEFESKEGSDLLQGDWNSSLQKAFEDLMSAQLILSTHILNEIPRALTILDTHDKKEPFKDDTYFANFSDPQDLWETYSKNLPATAGRWKAQQEKRLNEYYANSIRYFGPDEVDEAMQNRSNLPRPPRKAPDAPSSSGVDSRRAQESDLDRSNPDRSNEDESTDSGTNSD